jgi:hypothetical protein
MSSHTPAYDALTRTYRQIHHFSHLQSIVSWDTAVNMPPQGNDARAAAMRSHNPAVIPRNHRVEAALALFTGSLYGGVHTITGHPLDTIKSRMQMDASLAGRSALQVARTMWQQEGLRAFFRGCVPPLWGSMVYRGLMMSGYEFTFTYIDKEFGPESAMKQELLPSLLPIRPIVVVSSVFATVYCTQ